MFLLIFIVRESQVNQQRFKCILLNKCYLKSKILLKGLFIVYFFLHLFILQAIYIVSQDLKMKLLFVELNIRLQPLCRPISR